MPKLDKEKKEKKEGDKKADKPRDKSADGKSSKTDKESKKSKSKDKDAKSVKSSKSKDKDGKSSKSKDKDAKSTKSKSKDKDGKSVKSSKSAEKDKKASNKDEERKEVAADAKPDATMAGTFDRATLQMGATIQGTGLFGQPPNGTFKREGQLASMSVQTVCSIHGKPFQYYCETTESLICYDCTIMGPNNT